MTPDYRRSRPLVAPFLEALERGEDCFYGMVLNGAYLYAVLGKSGLREWADYAKWAAEAVFEHVRKTEFPAAYSRLTSHFFLLTSRTAGACLKPPGGGERGGEGGVPSV